VLLEVALVAVDLTLLVVVTWEVEEVFVLELVVVVVWQVPLEPVP